MGIVSESAGIIKAFTTWARRTRPMRTNPDRMPFLFGRPRSGVRYSEDIALTYSAVFACVRLISETVGQLSWHVFQRIAEARKLDDSHYVDFLIHTQPNPEMSSMSWRETSQAHALMWGNGYSEIERNRLSGRVEALWVLPPDRTFATRSESGALQYETTNDLGETVVLQPRSVFHLRGLSFNGVSGYSILNLARESVGLGLAAEYFGGAFFGRGVRPTGYIKYPGRLSPKAFAAVAESLRSEGGIDNQLHPMLLDGGMEWVNIGIPPDDAQFLETRKFQVREIARWFRVPPHKLADLEDSSVRANIEAENIAFVTDSIQPWVTRWEQEANAKLFDTPRRRRFTKMNLGTLLRGDTKQRFEGYKIAREIGLMNVNEERALEDMNPIPGIHGTQYIVPMNFTTAEGLAENAKPKPEPAPVPPQLPQPDDDAADDVDKVAVGQRGPVRSMFERALSRERKAIEAKNETDPEKFRVWLEHWYASHVESIVVECTSVMDSALTAAGCSAHTTRELMYASLAIGDYKDESVRSIMDAFLCGQTQDVLKRRCLNLPESLTNRVLDAAKALAMLSIMEQKSNGQKRE